MKKAAVLLFLVIGAASAQEAISISVDDERLSQCNLTESFINNARELINKQWNTSPYGFYNLTSSYCYDNSVSLTLLFKKDESSIKGDSISVSLYKSEVFDYSLIFTNQEDKLFSYSIKREYIDYRVNGTDNEYYASLSGDECSDLRSFYNSLNGEKYFNQEHGYCSIVIKTRTSDIKSLVDESVSFINYFGEEARYSFNGYSEGNYDLASLASSIDCELSSGSYYYPELETDCYGIYKDNSRIHLSAHTQISDYRVYINVYGIMGGKARLTASAYGDDINEAVAEEWVNNELNSYFPGQRLNLEGDESLSASKIVNSFEFNNNAVNGFDKRKDLMNTHYSGGNVSVTISEPYIQIYVPDALNSKEVGIVPPIYWGRYLIITNNRVYSSISLDDNNESLAVNKIKEFVDPYVTTSSWELNMTVTGNYYWPLFGLAETTNLRTMTETDAASIQTPTITQQAVSDPLSQEQAAGFEGLEEERKLTVIELIINFFKELFS